MGKIKRGEAKFLTQLKQCVSFGTNYDNSKSSKKKRKWKKEQKKRTQEDDNQCNEIPRDSNGAIQEGVGGVEMKVLNLYSGIGGNRKIWPKECEVTAIENNKEIAKI